MYLNNEGYRRVRRTRGDGQHAGGLDTRGSHFSMNGDNSLISMPQPLQDGLHDHRGSSISVVSLPTGKVIRPPTMFSPNGRRHSKGYRDGVGTKLSIIGIDFLLDMCFVFVL